MKKSKKFYSLLLTGTIVTTAISLVSIKSNEKELKKSKIIIEVLQNFNNLSIHNTDQESEELDNSKLSLLIVLKENISEDEISKIIEKFNNFKCSIGIEQSKLLNNFLIASADLKEDDNKLLFDFLEKNKFINVVYANVESEFTNTSIYHTKAKAQEYKIETLYLNNFKVNKYTVDFRDEIIDKFRDYINKNNDERIGVGVLEVGDKTDWFNHNALIESVNDYYFDTSKETGHIIINDWSKFYVPPFWNIKPQYGQHATHVASIIAGKNGVNPYLKLYGVKLNLLNNKKNVYKALEDEVLYLVKQKDLKIVNSSWGLITNDENLRKYNSYSHYFDEVARKNPEILFVFAAGNSGDEDSIEKRKLSGPQLSYNSIVVGSHNANREISDFSSYGSNSGKKVLLLANGENYNFKQKPNSKGTSYSAPFISGVLGNTLIEYADKYDYGKNNIIAMAVLSASTSLEFSQISKDFQSGLDDRSGSGVFNYSKLDQAFNNLKYIRWEREKSTINNKDNLKTTKDEIIIDDLEFKPNSNIRMSLAWEFNAETFYEKDKTKPDLNDFDLYIIDEDNKIIAKSVTEKNNIEYLRFKTNEKAKYKIKIVNSRFDPYKNNNIELALSWTVDSRYE